MSYILDTNVVSDYVNNVVATTRRLDAAFQREDELYLCQPVHYEIVRGLRRVNAVRKQQVFETKLLPLLVWLPLIDADWQQAAYFWAEATRRGKQLSDVDLLIAALAFRLDATLVSSDADFDVLPVRREDWRAL